MHATLTYPDTPHPPALAVWNDAADPDSWHVDASDGGNVLDLPVGCTEVDVDSGLASLGCRRHGLLWHQQTSRMWITAVEPADHPLFPG